jgi:hypothetical protein
MQKERELYARAQAVDLIEYLAFLGHEPKKIRNNDYWYLSPLRNENEPSFKINSKLNVWYDHGMGKGGNLVEFGKLYHKCSVKEFLAKLQGIQEISFSFHNQRTDSTSISNGSGDERIIITDCRQIADPDLRQYLHQRKIPLIIACRFCSEIEFELYGKKHLAIGFKNERDGYELRSEHFKGGSSPKNVTWIKNNPKKLSVYEGVFDFLSFQTELLSDRKLIHELTKNQDSYIILNSLAFFEQNREIMEQYQRINLFLDRDEAGLSATKQALKWSEKYFDESHRYTGFKDLNEFHIHCRKNNLKQSRRYHARL